MLNFVKASKYQIIFVKLKCPKDPTSKEFFLFYNLFKKRIFLISLDFYSQKFTSDFNLKMCKIIYAAFNQFLNELFSNISCFFDFRQNKP